MHVHHPVAAGGGRRRRRYGRPRPAATTAALLVLAISAPATAQQAGEEGGGRHMTFNPSLSVGYGYVDNVVQAGTPSSSTSSSAASASLTLPVRRDLTRGRFEVAYRGLFRSYESFNVLDHVDHYLDSRLEHRFRRRSKLELSARYTRTQEGGDPTRLQDGNVYISSRVERESYGASILFDHGIGARWKWSIATDAGKSKIASIKDFSPDTPPGIAPEGATSYGGALGIEREVSGRTSLGVRYRYQHFEPDTAPKEDVHEVVGRFTRTFRRKARLGFDFGGFSRSRAVETDYRTSGFTGGVDYSYGPVGRVRYTIGVAVAPTSGGSLAGTSTDTRVVFTITSENTRKWDLGFASYYARRVASVTTVPDVDTVSGSAWIERRFARKVSIRLDGNWVDQSSSLPGFSEGSYAYVNAFVVWYPLGGTRLAGR